MASPPAVSPFAPKSLPEVPAIEGVRFATAEAGIRYKGRTDLMVAVIDPGTAAAGVLTQSKTCSAPVLWCRESLKTGARAPRRQLGQRQRLHRQEGQRGCRDHGGALPPRPRGASRARSTSPRPA